MSTWDWNHQNFSDNTRATVLIIQMTVKEQRSRRDTEAMKHLFDLQVRNHKRSQVTWWELAYYQDVDPSLWLLYCRMNSFIFNWSVIKSSPLTQSETEQFTDHLFILTSQLQSSLTVDLLMWQTVWRWWGYCSLIWLAAGAKPQTCCFAVSSQPDAEWFRKQSRSLGCLTRLCLVFIKKNMVRRLESCELHSKSQQFTLQFLFFFLVEHRR